MPQHGSVSSPPQATSKMFIDLVQWLESPSTGEAYPTLNHVGINRLAFRVWLNSNKGTKTLTGFFATFYARRTFDNFAAPKIGSCLVGQFWGLTQPVNPHLACFAPARHSHCAFRGLLGVHSYYGLRAR